jgi:hypothetical protein
LHVVYTKNDAKEYTIYIIPQKPNMPNMDKPDESRAKRAGLNLKPAQG